jgi:hypothetical protein
MSCQIDLTMLDISMSFFVDTGRESEVRRLPAYGTPKSHSRNTISVDRPRSHQNHKISSKPPSPLANSPMQNSLAEHAVIQTGITLLAVV